MTENTLIENTLTTAIREPSLTADEAEMLMFALERSRAQFAWKCGGLDAAGLNRRQPPSTMTLGGLLKHLALVEDDYTSRFVTGETINEMWHVYEPNSDWEWRTAADHTPEELYAMWQGAVDRSVAAVTAALADGGPGQASKFVLDNGEAPNLRRALTDLHDEYARHVGHADLLREAVDGLVGEDPPQQ